MFLELLSQLGVLRVSLAILILVLVGFAPFAAGPVSYSGWAMVPSLVVPAIVPIVFFVLLLDMMMSRIFMVDQQGEGRARYRRILWLEGVLLVLMLLAWMPFFASLGVK
jgi:hypothetical protein